MDEITVAGKTYSRGTQLVMCMAFFVFTTISSAAATWVGITLGGIPGALIGFLIYIVVANAGTSETLMRKPELLPLYVRANPFRMLGVGTGISTFASAAGLGMIALVLCTLFAVAIAMVCMRITLHAAEERAQH